MNFEITRYERGHRRSLCDQVALEEPLEIRVESRSLSITMRTPGHDVELALGFLYGEGILQNASQVLSAQLCGPTKNVVKIKTSAPLDLAKLDRHFYTTSSCGVCGKTSLQALEQKSPYTPFPEDWGIRVTPETLLSLPERLRARQDVFSTTGGLHASGLFTRDGEFFQCREDVGRHNALDKLVGFLFQQEKIPANEFGILLSGRASFELIQKSVMMGCAFVAAVGAPSSLAVELAVQTNLTLVGFLRESRFNIYSAPFRVGGCS